MTNFLPVSKEEFIYGLHDDLVKEDLATFSKKYPCSDCGASQLIMIIWNGRYCIQCADCASSALMSIDGCCARQNWAATLDFIDDD